MSSFYESLLDGTPLTVNARTSAATALAADAFRTNAPTKIGARLPTSAAATLLSKRPKVVDGEVLSERFYARFHDAFEDGGEVEGQKLDIEAMTDSGSIEGVENISLVEICSDLMLYEDPELFETAFSLLTERCFMREPCVGALRNVVLLDSPLLFRNFQSLGKEVPLRVLCTCCHVSHQP